MHLCWNAIVRNESARIERCLQSLVGHIDSYVVLDTGSTDGTPKLIDDFFRAHNIPGETHLGEFKTWDQARNDALALARVSRIPWDYVVLVDADMELKVDDPDWRNALTTGASYDAIQKSGTIAYANRRFISRKAEGWYVGVTHEYLDIPSGGMVPGIWFFDHADGANRPDKFNRDIRLLKAALKEEPCPQRGRYLFYLGNSYRDAGKPDRAVRAYRDRVQLGGWDEEQWNAQVNLAECHRDMNDEEGYVKEALVAFEMRPTRAEPIYGLAKYYREKGKNAIASMFAARAMDIPMPPNDMLFVNEHAHGAGPREEFSITAFYVPRFRKAGFKVNDGLALDLTVPPSSRALAKQNMYHYVPPLHHLVPGVKHQRIDFTPPEGYVAMNPSIIQADGLRCAIRCVNYTIDEHGRYLIRNTETGEITNDNPIHTRTFITELNPETLAVTKSVELKYDLGEPKFSLVRGFEDVRLDYAAGLLRGSACVREVSHEGRCDQARFRINDDGSIDDLVIMTTSHHEKNWVPFKGVGLYLYRLGQIFDPIMGLLGHPPARYDVGETSGGSQLIPWADGWLGVFHEARYDPSGKRYYYHRFVLTDFNGTPKKRSLPFVFKDRQIEFAMGLADTRQGLVISYGLRDCEPWLAIVPPADIEGILEPC